MTNETTASQPKSIGEDNKFISLMNEWDQATHERSDEVFDRIADYVHEYFRAPAAQASATIQAAPVGWEPVYMTWDDSIMAWVDVGLAEYEAAEPDERRTTYQPAEVN